MSEHTSVLLSEAIEALHINKGGKYIDATVGAAGHTAAILKAGGVVLGIDDDPIMLALAKKKLSGETRYRLVPGNFRNLKTIAQGQGFDRVDGILFDLGISTIHYADERGFSFSESASLLDMRLNPQTQAVTAADLVNSLPESQLAVLFEDVMTFKPARRLANKIVKARSEKKIKTVGDFLEIVGEGRKPMMALRMAVNSEVENLKAALPQALSLLKTGGRLVVISFHSGEDRIVKEFFGRFGRPARPVIASQAEVIKNPSARSAKMRVLIKI
ncbi:16S rRNA (cytosine(1402)-N(4))-methyltransferase [Candidatus Woesebacteria bacterium RIFCSPHIGHO2_01_FULL_44_10]|uniref:Ribosomal RNA small subunit methyltransferase H n=1 Tax=Candidatus Woesebacteria bacterium RIFCSPLOWO2_01_FULL_44_14 TaxID=1802525 RepID=A0A1F8C374_9BACT|nr:MAG: 16S rRNA (cytosine(1402)-N(4))-methyltransferase [Candidatus Woesebacteria bacterium RIFCSPHIGHO2_01_FULL_44_10]OGM56021.1 MAG: 16S rRNA (cytosine(1402)-N(4))-methyltransferase [Candidatus Woesebacteria bacterium RIFCSPHIGHO2_12_FULL_44_11]OGM70743.1 MAG: 16S rRNA (cytosine(1402)-N(4))-methyltransferase [Candidatus Woesebacteria bacterium RIFCSPLOWO2_01_FULL_44_14]